MIGGLAGVPFLGFLTIGFGGTLLCFAIIVGYTAAFSAVNTFIGLLNDPYFKSFRAKSRRPPSVNTAVTPAEHSNILTGRSILIF